MPNPDPPPAEAGRSPRRLRALVWMVPALVVLGVLASSYLPFISDDALISLRYAERLLEGNGLTWTDGERVEGYSNLLWILLCAGPGLFGVDLIVAARALGLLAAAAALVAVVWAHRPRGGADALPALGASLALALCGPLSVWSIGGLEQALQAGLLAWALVACYPLLEAPADGRGWVLPGLLLGLLCWTRPDAPLFTVGVAAGLLAARGIRADTARTCARLIALPLMAWGLQLSFRLVYYEAWLPNSALAKVAFTAHRLREGSAYLGEGLFWLGGLLLPAAGFSAVALFGRGAAGRRARFLLLPLGLWCAYVAVIGGDSFPARRYLVPVAVLLAMLLANGVQAFLRRWPRIRWTAWAALAICIVGLGWMQQRDPQNERARLERWEWDGAAVGSMLARAFPQRPLLAVDPAGTLPYFSRLPALDMLGINDRWLARNRPDDFGRGALGHELGNGAYVLDREPDLVVFCGPQGRQKPCFRSGKEMVRDPRFRRDYRMVIFELDEPAAMQALIWVRAESARAGVRRSEKRVEVPAFLFMNTGRSVARVDDRDRIYVPVGPGAPAGMLGLELGSGKWRARALGEGDPLRLTLFVFGRRAEGQDGEGLDFLVPPGPPPFVDVAVECIAGEARFYGVEFERLP